MRGELFITCLLGDFLSKIPGQFVLVSTSFGSGDNPSGDKLSFIGSGLPSPSVSASRFRGFSSMFSAGWSLSMTTSHTRERCPLAIGLRVRGLRADISWSPGLM